MSSCSCLVGICLSWAAAQRWNVVPILQENQDFVIRLPLRGIGMMEAVERCFPGKVMGRSVAWVVVVWLYDFQEFRHRIELQSWVCVWIEIWSTLC